MRATVQALERQRDGLGRGVERAVDSRHVRPRTAIHGGLGGGDNRVTASNIADRCSDLHRLARVRLGGAGRHSGDARAEQVPPVADEHVPDPAGVAADHAIRLGPEAHDLTVVADPRGAECARRRGAAGDLGAAVGQAGLRRGVPEPVPDVQPVGARRRVLGEECQEAPVVTEPRGGQHLEWHIDCVAGSCAGGALGHEPAVAVVVEDPRSVPADGRLVSLDAARPGNSRGRAGDRVADVDVPEAAEVARERLEDHVPPVTGHRRGAAAGIRRLTAAALAHQLDHPGVQVADVDVGEPRGHAGDEIGGRRQEHHVPAIRGDLRANAAGICRSAIGRGADQDRPAPGAVTDEDIGLVVVIARGQVRGDRVEHHPRPVPRDARPQARRRPGDPGVVDADDLGGPLRPVTHVDVEGRGPTGHQIRSRGPEGHHRAVPGDIHAVAAHRCRGSHRSRR